MRLAKLLTAVAVVSMASAPVMAAPANPAAKLSVASAKSVRTSATAEKSNKMAGGVLIAVLAAAAVIAGIVVIADDNGSPASP